MGSYLDDGLLPPCDESDSEEEEEESLCDGLGGLEALGPDVLVYESCRVAEAGPERCVLAYTYRFCGSQVFECRATVERRGLRNDWVARAAAAFAPSGLVVLCWVWMAVPSARVVRVDAENVPLRGPEDCDFWEGFYQDAFAEFAAVHGLRLDEIRLKVVAGTDRESPPPSPSPSPLPPPQSGRGGKRRVLCGLGGGKDSLVARELCLRQAAVGSVDWFYVADGLVEFDRSTRLRAIVAASGAKHKTVVLRRDFDYEALARQRATRHAACGHPWAALVAFDGIAAARLYGYDAVVVGNERSATEGNGLFVQGGGRLEVNHQFDKSLAYERKIAAYCDRHDGGIIMKSMEEEKKPFPCVDYFSPLQPLWEVQIAALFCLDPALDPYWRLFRSCNESGDCDEWCARCDKCCFVCALVAAFAFDRYAEIFDGDDPLDRAELLPAFETLAGLTPGATKPLECVGTADEARLALWLAKRAATARNSAKPHVLAALPALDDPEPIRRALHILSDVAGDHALPKWWAIDDKPEPLLQLEALAETLRRELA